MLSREREGGEGEVTVAITGSTETIGEEVACCCCSIFCSAAASSDLTSPLGTSEEGTTGATGDAALTVSASCGCVFACCVSVTSSVVRVSATASVSGFASAFACVLCVSSSAAAAAASCRGASACAASLLSAAEGSVGFSCGVVEVRGV